jgi:hypothetical protein
LYRFIAPTIWLAILEPIKGRAWVWWNMLYRFSANNLPLELEDLLAFEAVSNGAIEQRSFDPFV